DGSLLARDGSALAAGATDEFQLNSYTSSTQNWPEIAALPDGGWIAVWYGNSATDSAGITARRFDAAGNPVEPDGSPLVGTGEWQVNSAYTSYSQADPKVAALLGVNAGKFVITWESQHEDGSDYAVTTQIYNADGTPDGASFFANSTLTAEQSNPEITALSDGGFFISWHSFNSTDGLGLDTGDGERYGVFAQRFDASGAAMGSELQINSFTADDQTYPSVTELSNGNIVVVWTDDTKDLYGQGIFATVIAPDGSEIVPEFRVNDQTINGQYDPHVAALDTGGFVIVYTDANGTDGSSEGVYAQQYSASGGRVDSQFLVNSETSSTQFQPSITALADGGFAIAWTSYTSGTAGDGNSYGVFYQTYANATPLALNVDFSGDEDTIITLDAASFEASFSDPDGQSLQAIRIESLPALGTLALNGAPVVPSQVVTIADLQAG
ncbi:MAG: hypothetical protein ACPGVJ_10245, partial [Mangrovicoccus sp.]